MNICSCLQSTHNDKQLLLRNSTLCEGTTVSKDGILCSSCKINLSWQLWKLLPVSFAMLTCLQTMLTWLNSWTGRGLIVQRWPIATWELIIASSVCVKNHLHIASTVSLRWWNIISWNTYSVHSQNSPYLFIFYDSCLTFPVLSLLFVFVTLIALSTNSSVTDLYFYTILGDDRALRFNGLAFKKPFVIISADEIRKSKQFLSNSISISCLESHH